MSTLLKVVAGLSAAFGVLAIVLSFFMGGGEGRFEAALDLFISALVLAAIARLLDTTAALRSQIDHIQIQVDKIRWERKQTPGQP